MDPDGTWHNLRPIAKLALSGPDQEPRRYSDKAAGGGWFVSKNPVEEAAADSGQPAAEASGKAGGTDGPSGNGQDPQAGNGQGAQAQGGDGTAGGTQAENGPAAGARAETGPGGTTQAGNGPGSGTGAGNGPGSGTDAGNGPGSGTGAENGAAAETRAEAAAGEERAAGSGKAAPAQQGPELAPHLPLTAAELSAIRWRLDGGTLREVVDDREALRALGERLDGPLADEADNIVKAGLLSVRAEVYRLLGELGMAAAASRLALAHAESAQDLQSMVIAQAELAHVLRLRGDFLEADRLFQRAVDADVSAAVRSVVHENAGRSCFDQGRHMEALDHFARAIRLGAPEDTDLAERVGVCLESVYIHVLRDGWGPYPRRSAEILGLLSERANDDGEPGQGGGALDEATAEQPVVRPR